eukprot:EC718169.1.p1 GENE.EC718169.1~~EC718169.1.p1  ORF type:complete len:61 (+),score=7.02 EC718169.1:74-256(+)
MSDRERIFSAEQINIPEELGDVVKEYTKAVIRAQPADLIEWSAKWFAEMVGKRSGQSAGH